LQYISPRRLYFATTSNLNPPCQAPKYPSLPRHSSSSRTHVAQKSLTASCFSKCAAARQTTTSVSLPGSTPLAMLQSTAVSLLQSTAVSLLQSTKACRGRQICQQARQRANQACLHCDRQRRKRVWESHGAKRLTFQIFFDGCVAVEADELQK